MAGSRWFVVASTLGLIAWLFAPALFQGQICAYRDAAHFYYPLFQFVHDEWAAGRVPLWNPYENGGMPLLASGTPSALYPGQLLFHLRLPYAATFNIYLVLHLLLAAGGAYRLARHWGADAIGAGLASLSYAFAGSVLFQYCNVVFLVGAAWLPWAARSVDCIALQGSRRAAVSLALWLTLMVLGGDPQIAYHVVLLAMLYLLLVGRASRGTDHLSLARPSQRWAALGLAVTIALGLSAAQTIPSWELARQTDRAAFYLPRSLYELPAYLARDDHTPSHTTRDLPWFAGLFTTIDGPGHHNRSIYRYSVPPWRWLELIWPNLAGRSFPINHRWTSAWPAETSVWVPSMYAGLLPLALAFTAFRLRRAPLPQRWMSYTLLLAVLASLGAYGPAWLTSEAFSLLGQGANHVDPSNHDAAGLSGGVGGLYWLMNVALPGYVQFRYPAKWLVVAALALSMLAAFGWSTLDRRSASRALSIVALLSLVVVCATFGLRASWNDWLSHAPPDRLFGPLDANGAWYDLLRAATHTLVLSLILLFLLRRWNPPSPCKWRWLAVAITVVDLALAQGHMIATVPASALTEPSHGFALLSRARHRFDDHPLDRIDRGGLWLNDEWQHSSAPHRLTSVVHWQRATFWPKYPLIDRASQAVVGGTFMPLDLRAVLDTLQSPTEPSRVAEFWNFFNVRYVLRPNALPNVDLASQPTLQSVGQLDPSSPSTQRVQLLRNPSALPRAWIVHQVECLTPIDETNPAQVWSRTAQVFGASARARDFRQQAVVETAASLDPPPRAVDPTPLPDEACRIMLYEPTRVVVEASLAAPGLIVLADRYDDNWHATVETDGPSSSRPRPIWRTNRIQRGVWLPAGTHRVTYRYRPASFRWGLVLSCSTFALLGIAAIGPSVRRLTRPRSTSPPA